MTVLGFTFTWLDRPSKPAETFRSKSSSSECGRWVIERWTVEGTRRTGLSIRRRRWFERTQQPTAVMAWRLA